MIKIKHKNRLTPEDIRSITELYEISSSRDGIIYAPDFTGDGFVIAYYHKKIIGFLEYFYTGIPEVSICVHPFFRRKGIGSRLVRKPGFDDFVLTGKDNSPGFDGFAAAIGFTCRYHEYLMKYEGGMLPCNTDVTYEAETGQFFSYSGGTETASCRICEEEHTVNIYDVFVREEFRRMGYATGLVSYVLNTYYYSGKKIILQVSELNTGAYKLYLSLGFRPVDSVLYYTK